MSMSKENLIHLTKLSTSLERVKNNMTPLVPKARELIKSYHANPSIYYQIESIIPSGDLDSVEVNYSYQLNGLVGDNRITFPVDAFTVDGWMNFSVNRMSLLVWEE